MTKCKQATLLIKLKQLNVLDKDVISPFETIITVGWEKTSVFKTVKDGFVI